MKLTAEPASLEFVNQSECSVVEDITYELPRVGQRHGINNLFLHATAEDLRSAAAIGERGLALSNRVREASNQPAIKLPGGYRKPGTLYSFKPYSIRGNDFDVLCEVTLLTAVQDMSTPPSNPDSDVDMPERQRGKLQRVIEKARLLGAVIINTELVAQHMGSLATRFIDHYNAVDPSFRNSAGNAARALLEAIGAEYDNAVYGTYRGGLLRPWEVPRDQDPTEALKSYRNDNPLIVELANLHPDTAN